MSDKVIILPVILISILILYCSGDKNDSSSQNSDIDDISGCTSILDCSNKETRDAVCVKKGCLSIGEPSQMLHIVFYPKYISSVVSNISFFKYFFLYPLDISGETLTCESLLKDYNFDTNKNYNVIQSYEKQASISSTGSEMYTLPLPALKDSIIFFVFYSDKWSVLALGCADRIDTTSSDAVGIFPCKPDQTNACLGQF
jgi:hypothetical protein